MSARAAVPSRLAGLTRFGQVNFTEADVELADVDFWRDIWRRSGIEAVLLNCGGIRAYHPTRLEGHPLAAGVERRDLLGEMTTAARELGIEVVGRLDVGVVDQRFRDLHPGWMMQDRDGASRTLNDVTGGVWGRTGGPRIEDEMYYSCINSGLFTDYLPRLLAEVADDYDVAGFFTNGFPTVALDSPSTRMRCWCATCLALWSEATGRDEYPEADDPDDPAFREYVAFLRRTSLDRMRELSATTRALGDGLSFNTSAIPALDGGLPWNEWVDEVDVLFCDNQDRSADYGRATPSHGLWEVGLSSEILRSVAQGRVALRVQSTARMRHGGRHSSKNPAELRLQQAEALAHGEFPMWHAVSAAQHSRRWIDTVVDFDRWLADAAPPLAGRTSIADVGVVWSQESSWLRDWDPARPGPVFGDALAGWHLVLSRARIPAQLVLADGKEGFDGLRAIVLPSGLALTADAVQRILDFVARGGALVVNGDAGRVDEWGAPHPGDPIGAAVGVERTAAAPEGPVASSYLLLEDLPLIDRTAVHPDEDLVAGGTWRTPFTATTARAALRWVPSEYVIPTHAAGLPAPTEHPTVAWTEDGHRTVLLGADLDARFFRHRIREHRHLLGATAGWLLGDAGPGVTVDGDGVLDVRSWRVEHDLVVVLVNLDNHGAHEEPAESFRPVGPFVVRVGTALEPVGSATATRGGAEVVARRLDDGGLAVDVPKVVDFEVLRIPLADGGAR